MTTVSIDLKDLTREQLEREVDRLQGLTDRELRRRVDVYQEEAYRAGHQLDDICSCLNYHGFSADNPPHSVRLMARRMIDAETKLAAVLQENVERSHKGGV